MYAGSYIGRIDRFDRETGRTRNTVIYPQMGDGVAPKNLEYRFQWNAPIEFPPFGSHDLYHTSNYVHRTVDGGTSWETISGDLTRNDTTKQFLPGGPASVLSSRPLSSSPGHHRVTWNLLHPGPELVEGAVISVS